MSGRRTPVISKTGVAKATRKVAGTNIASKGKKYAPRRSPAKYKPKPLPFGDANPPSREDLSPNGVGQDVLTQGQTMALAALVIRLKARREARGLTLADVARRSRLTIQGISRLENHHARNPTLDSVFRYALALGALPTLDFEEVDPTPDEG